MGNMQSADFHAGVRNMLMTCAGMEAGQSLLVVTETGEGADYYERDLGDAVAAAAGSLGLETRRYAVPFTPDPCPPSPTLEAEMRAADRTLFLARIGDQLRFRPELAAGGAVVSYALDRETLGSMFGRADYRAFIELKACVDRAIGAARRVRITCPLGTLLEGPGVPLPADGDDVGVRRFPLSVFAPVLADNYSGRVVQDGFLVGTGASYYQPYMLPLDAPLTVRIERGRITGFTGDSADVADACAHYHDIAERYGLRGDVVHSWHAGIHPGCAYPEPAARHPQRWSGTAFGNPRLLHLHTCGERPPGEISLNVVDPTVELDGTPVWEVGRFYPERLPGGAEILARYPCEAALFAAPEQALGLGPNGRLSGH